MLKYLKKTSCGTTLLVIALIVSLGAFWSILITCNEIGNYGGWDQNTQPHCNIFQGPITRSILFTLDSFDKHHGAVTAIATIFIAAFTATLWWSTKGMLHSTNESINLARQEFLSSHRPHMRLKHIWLETNFSNGEPIEARLDVVNFGTTPGLITVFNYLTLLIPRWESLPQRPPYNETDQSGRNVHYQFTGSEKPLGIGITFTRSVCDGRVLSPTEITEVLHGNILLYFIGTIEYWTAIGGARQTAFCRYLTFDDPNNFTDMGRFVIARDPDYEYQD